MPETIIQQGRFRSNGLRKILAIRSDLDWMKVYNYSATQQDTEDRPIEFYWQRGMSPGRGLKTVKLGTEALDPLTSLEVGAGQGFTLVNQGSDAVISSGTAFTSITNATQPVVATGSTVGLQEGDVVILSQAVGGLDGKALLGIDFQIDTIINNTSFVFASELANTVGAATNGIWRRVNISSIFYPQTRYIINIVNNGDTIDNTISSATQPIIVTSVAHGYVTGQEVRFHITSSVNGMTEINELTAPIISTDDDNPFIFQVELDTTGFTAFKFPTTAQVPAAGYTPAFVGPVGENTAVALNSIPVENILSDATVNTAIIGMQLSAGVEASANVGPAGEVVADVGDLIYWVAGKSFSVTNE